MECRDPEERLTGRLYRIGRVLLELRMPEDMTPPENLELFRAEDTGNTENAAGVEDRVVYTIRWTDRIGTLRKELRGRMDPGFREIRRRDLELFRVKTDEGSGECRIIGIPGQGKPYAVSCQTGKRAVRVWFDREIGPMLGYDTVFDAALSLEKRMIEDGAMILHSAYMCLNGKAVLFSAPSETGKSTQAELWERYRGTRTVNGDRSLLTREPDGWYAGGWPICGSSEICHNEAMPVRAIVMLRQAKENRAYRLPGGQAFRELMAQITSNTWDRAFQTAVADQLERLIGETPVLRLECDISEQAVACLENCLRTL